MIPFVHNYSFALQIQSLISLHQCGGSVWSESMQKSPRRLPAKQVWASESYHKQESSQEERCSSPDIVCQMSMSDCLKPMCCFLKSIRWCRNVQNLFSLDCIQGGLNTFGPRVPQFWQKFFWCFSTWKNWDLALRNIFWSLGCVKNDKNVKIVKNQVFQGIVAISP